MEYHAHSWQRPPEPITEIRTEETVDVVVLGAGIAGTVAAHSAAEAGAEVVCVEKFAAITAHGTDICGVNTKVQERAGIHVDPKAAARLVYAWGQQQGNYTLIRTYTERSGEMLNHYIDLLEQEGYCITINDEMTARTDWDTLDDRYRMFRTPHIIDVPEGSNLPKERWNMAYLVKAAFRHAQAHGARFLFNTSAEQLVREGGKVTGVIVRDKDGFRKINARKGVILATGGITDNKEMIECFCPIALRVDKIDNFPKGGNMGDGLVMGKWVGSAFSRCYPAPVIHPVNFTVLGPGMNSSWLTVNRNGLRFSNEVAYEPIVTNARMNAPGNVAYAVWDSHYLENFKRQEPAKFARIKEDIPAAVERAVAEGDYYKADTLAELAEQIGVPADALAATVARYNQLCAAGDDVDFGVPERFLSPVLDGPFYASKITAWLLSLPYGLHVDANSQVCDEDDQPIGGLFAVGNVQGDFFANSYPVTLPGSNNGRSVCFGRLVGMALAKGERLDGTKL
ncbi:MAG: FAD-dependent oxidoreductase [Oscillospiraceae bacterium]|nr:FAD-dependent oxidoreductase [Oscillospiraceae bacterium]